jgi:hypothetical protein
MSAEESEFVPEVYTDKEIESLMNSRVAPLIRSLAHEVRRLRKTNATSKNKPHRAINSR